MILTLLIQPDIQIIGEGTDTLKNIENIQFNDVQKLKIS